MSVLLSFVRTLRVSLRTRAALQVEILAVQHQLQVVLFHNSADIFQVCP